MGVFTYSLDRTRQAGEKQGTFKCRNALKLPPIAIAEMACDDNRLAKKWELDPPAGGHAPCRGVSANDDFNENNVFCYKDGDKNRWCLWRPDHAGFDSRSIFGQSGKITPHCATSSS